MRKKSQVTPKNPGWLVHAGEGGGAVLGGSQTKSQREYAGIDRSSTRWTLRIRMPCAKRDFLVKLLFAERSLLFTPVPSGGQKMPCCLFRINRSTFRLPELNAFPLPLLEEERKISGAPMFPSLSVWMNSFPRPSSLTTVTPQLFRVIWLTTPAIQWPDLKRKSKAICCLSAIKID